jgi:hypothetical protein
MKRQLRTPRHRDRRRARHPRPRAEQDLPCRRSPTHRRGATAAAAAPAESPPRLHRQAGCCRSASIRSGGLNQPGFRGLRESRQRFRTLLGAVLTAVSPRTPGAAVAVGSVLDAPDDRDRGIPTSRTGDSAPRSRSLQESAGYTALSLQRTIVIARTTATAAPGGSRGGRAEDAAHGGPRRPPLDATGRKGPAEPNPEMSPPPRRGAWKRPGAPRNRCKGPARREVAPTAAARRANARLSPRTNARGVRAPGGAGGRRSRRRRARRRGARTATRRRARSRSPSGSGAR